MSEESKSGSQKLRLLYLYKILNEMTDDSHMLTSSEIISELEKYGVSAERKTVYNDVNLLKEFGVDILSGRGKILSHQWQSSES